MFASINGTDIYHAAQTNPWASASFKSRPLWCFPLHAGPKQLHSSFYYDCGSLWYEFPEKNTQTI